MSHMNAFGADLQLQDFVKALRSGAGAAAQVSRDLIGNDVYIAGRDGPVKLVYADYVGSGRAYRPIETFITEHVLPYYANCHTSSSFCGDFTTRLREDARTEILRLSGGNISEHAAIFSGAGATSGINRLIHLLGLADAVRNNQHVSVLIGPYEHHANILPWRESGAEVIEMPEGAEGGPDLGALKTLLESQSKKGIVIVSLSAASNVTGICADVEGITRIVKRAGAISVWDYAGGAPYLPIQLCPNDDAQIDALVFSPHKFVGGPGASGVMIVRRDIVRTAKPSQPGGGTVSFVSAQEHDYLASLEETEEGGTPNILGDIRASLVMLLKDAVGQEFISARDSELAERGMAAFNAYPNVNLLASTQASRLPVFSFTVNDGAGNLVSHRDFTKSLSDIYGIQARSGWACAGPYSHRLLDISTEKSCEIREQIHQKSSFERPGFIRLNLSYTMSDETVDYILNSVEELAQSYGQTP